MAVRQCKRSFLAAVDQDGEASDDLNMSESARGISQYLLYLCLCDFLPFFGKFLQYNSCLLASLVFLVFLLTFSLPALAGFPTFTSAPCWGGGGGVPSDVPRLADAGNFVTFFYFLNMHQSWAGQSKLRSKNKATMAH